MCNLIKKIRQEKLNILDNQMFKVEQDKPKYVIRSNVDQIQLRWEICRFIYHD